MIWPILPTRHWGFDDGAVVHVVVAAQLVAHAVGLQAGDEIIAGGGIRGQVCAEEDVLVVLADHVLVGKNERMAVRRLGRKHRVDPGHLVDRVVVVA